MQLFGREWSDRFVEAWNRSVYRTKLSRLGTVRFRLLGDDTAVTLHWDQEGYVVSAVDATGEIPTFSADRRGWEAFIAGEFSATRGVLNGAISYDGRLSRILPYTLAFDSIADVAHGIGRDSGLPRDADGAQDA